MFDQQTNISMLQHSSFFPHILISRYWQVSSASCFSLLSCLCLVKFEIKSLLFHKFSMLALFCDNAVSYNTDFISILYGGESMGNNNTSSTFPGLVQGLLHHLEEMWITYKHSDYRISNKLQSFVNIMGFFKGWYCISNINFVLF